jgi:transcription termination factor Rho
LVYAILDQQAITPEQALPKKKPSSVEVEVKEEKPSPSPKQEQKEENKPKFRRQNFEEQAKEEKAFSKKSEKPAGESQVLNPELQNKEESLLKPKKNHPHLFMLPYLR